MELIIRSIFYLVFGAVRSETAFKNLQFGICCFFGLGITSHKAVLVPSKKKLINLVLIDVQLLVGSVKRNNSRI